MLTIFVAGRALLNGCGSDKGNSSNEAEDGFGREEHCSRKSWIRLGRRVGASGGASVRTWQAHSCFYIMKRYSVVFIRHGCHVGRSGKVAPHMLLIFLNLRGSRLLTQKKTYEHHAASMRGRFPKEAPYDWMGRSQGITWVTLTCGPPAGRCEAHVFCCMCQEVDMPTCKML